MDKEEVFEIIDLFSKKGLTRLNIRTQEFQIDIEKQAGMKTESILNEIQVDSKSLPSKIEKISDLGEEVKENFFKLESPMVGVFYERLSPESDPLVRVGDFIEEGDTVCVLEAMKMINEISSPVKGIVKKINFKDEDLVQYGDVIMEIEEDV